jgi:hypothetical protein
VTGAALVAGAGRVVTAEVLDSLDADGAVESGVTVGFVAGSFVVTELRAAGRLTTPAFGESVDGVVGSDTGGVPAAELEAEGFKYL